MITPEMKKKIVKYLKDRGAVKIAVFGSYARNEEHTGSDIDILVDLRERKSLLDLVGMEQDLTDELGLKVDLLTERSISPYLIEGIRNEMNVVYG